MNVIHFLSQLLLIFFEVKNVILFMCLLKHTALTDVINVLHKLRQMSCVVGQYLILIMLKPLFGLR